MKIMKFCVLLCLLVVRNAHGQLAEKLSEIKKISIQQIATVFDGGTRSFSFETEKKYELEINLVHRLKVDDKGEHYVEGKNEVIIECMYLYERYKIVNKSKEEGILLNLIREEATRLPAEEQEYLNLFSNVIETRSTELRDKLIATKRPKGLRLGASK